MNGRLREECHQSGDGSDDTGRHGPQVFIEGFEFMGDAHFKCIYVCPQFLPQFLNIRPHFLNIRRCCDISPYRVTNRGDHSFGLGIVEAGSLERLGGFERVENGRYHRHDDGCAPGACQGSGFSREHGVTRLNFRLPIPGFRVEFPVDYPGFLAVVAKVPRHSTGAVSQPRIVAKVDELMELCNRLEANFEDGDDGRGRLVGALLHETLKQDGGPALVGRPLVRLE